TTGWTHRRSRSAFSWPGGRRGVAAVVGQRDRDVPRLPVQVLRAARAQARRRTRRRRSDGSAETGPVHSYGLRTVLQPVAAARTSCDHGGEPRDRARLVRGRRGTGGGATAVGSGSGARADPPPRSE